MKKISAETVRADFNDLPAIIHYTRAAHELGLWASERALIPRFFPDRSAPLLEAGCGAGRVTLGLWRLGYRDLTAFDFARELVDQAVSLATERGATAIRFLHADATDLTHCHLLNDTPPSPPREGVKPECHPLNDTGHPPAREPADPGCHLINDTSKSLPSETAQPKCHLLNDTSSGEPSAAGPGKCHLIDDTFSGALFVFNGLMQIPGRENRRRALRELARVCRTGAPLMFTTHDRDHSPAERALWRLETLRWVRGEQDPRLVEFGDRYFEDESGRTFMHLPDRREILEDLAATGWRHEFDEMRSKVARESRAVREFSDECRFWVARK